MESTRRRAYASFALLSPACAALLLAACGDGSEDEHPSTVAGATTGVGGGGTGSGAGGGGAAPSPACPDGAAKSSALAFDGVDDYVTMGVAPELGLSALTIEAWVRRDGAGTATGTGVGGVSLVPIAGKGRGENDGSNVDCNYQFGFAGNVLGADFEDLATGLNHPILGKTPVSWGEWHHVGASYDGTTWRLYLDGKLDAELAANAELRNDSIQHFGIGAAFDSMGTALGRLHGAVDEVRVWDHARTDAEIAAGMYETNAQGDGLVGRWALDQKDGAVDSVGPNDGTVAGEPAFVEPGAVLDHGLAPALSAPSPADGDTVAGTSVELSIDIDDPDSKEFVVEFHVRELSEGDDFTVVTLPDTQYYTVQGSGLEHYFYDQTQWILDNRDAYNIVGVIHNGDIVDNGGLTYQWTIADKAMSALEMAQAGFPDGFPYGVSVGNHDQVPNSNAGGTANFNKYFGVARFEGRSYYGGHYGSTNDESWYTFSAGNLEFVVVNLQYDTTPDPAVIAWARTVFEAHPDAFGVLNSHYILGGTAAFGVQGQAIYDGLKDVQNLQLMTCGHVSAESRRTDTFEGHPIHSMLADYQGRVDGGSGWMRIWEFSPANDELTVRSYSPTLKKFETDEDSEFTLEVDLKGAGGPFEKLATVDPAVGQASAEIEGLAAGKTYEWYATASDCAYTVQSPIHRFRTK